GADGQSVGADRADRGSVELRRDRWAFEISATRWQVADEEHVAVAPGDDDIFAAFPDHPDQPLACIGIARPVVVAVRGNRLRRPIERHDEPTESQQIPRESRRETFTQPALLRLAQQGVRRVARIDAIAVAGLLAQTDAAIAALVEDVEAHELAEIEPPVGARRPP